MTSMASLLSRVALLFCGALLAGCQASLGQLRELAGEHGRQVDSLAAKSFVLTYSAPTTRPGQRLRVYLEGDGHAWATRSQPSLDPSPRHLLVAGLAFTDPQPSLYLARPCQYRQTTACHTALWTDRRYAVEIVDSLDEALNQLKARYGNREFELIGYSGGATLVLLLAARRSDVTQIQTLAGNLSPQRWVELKSLSMLDGSLEPLEQRERLRLIPQRHLLGNADRIIPVELLNYYRKALEPADCLERALLPGVEHASGWAEVWPSWQARPLSCHP